MSETTALFVTFPRRARLRHVDLALALAMLNRALRPRRGVLRASRRARSLEVRGEPDDRLRHAKPVGA